MHSAAWCGHARTQGNNQLQRLQRIKKSKRTPKGKSAQELFRADWIVMKRAASVKKFNPCTKASWDAFKADCELTWTRTQGQIFHILVLLCLINDSPG
jgi:hypothetical protein